MIEEKTYSSAIEYADNYTSWILSRLEPFIGKRVLEVGLGHGAYRRHLPPLEFYAGIDIDADAVEEARRQYPNDVFFCGDVADGTIVRRLNGASVDTVLCVNVLEHIEDDARAIREMISTLSIGGHLLLFLPAFEALFSDMDRLAGHWRRYSRGDLSRLVSGLRARVVVGEYFNPIGGVGWWTNKFVKHDSLDDASINRQIAVFDRWIVPISKLLDPLTRSVFGQSLICAIEKT